MPLNYNEINIKGMALALYRAKKDLMKIQDMNNLMYNQFMKEEDKILYTIELEKLEQFGDGYEKCLK